MSAFPHHSSPLPKRALPVGVTLLAALCLGCLAPFVSQEKAVVVLALAGYAVSAAILYSCQEGAAILTPSYLFFVFYSVAIFAGSLLLYIESGEPQLVFTVSLALGSYSVGVLAATALLRFRPSREFVLFRSRPWQDTWRGPAFGLAFLVALGTAALLALLYFRGFGVPLLALNTEVARLTAVRGAGYLFHGFTLLLTVVLVVAMMKSQFWGGRWRFVEGAVLVLGFGLLLLTAFRAPLAALIVYFVLSRQLYRTRTEWVKVITLSLLFLLVFGFVTWRRYTLGMHERALRSAPQFLAAAIEDRILLTNPRNLEFVLALFPRRHAYLGGASYVMGLKALRPGADIGFGGWLTSQHSRRLAGVTGMTPTVVGEFYANYGTLGAIAGMLCLGLLIQLIYAQFLRGRKTIGRTAFVVFLTGSLAWTVMGGLGRFVFAGLAPALVIFWLLHLAGTFRFAPKAARNV